MKLKTKLFRIFGMFVMIVGIFLLITVTFNHKEFALYEAAWSIALSFMIIIVGMVVLSVYGQEVKKKNG